MKSGPLPEKKLDSPEVHRPWATSGFGTTGIPFGISEQPTRDRVGAVILAWLGSRAVGGPLPGHVHMVLVHHHTEPSEDLGASVGLDRSDSRAAKARQQESSAGRMLRLP